MDPFASPGLSILKTFPVDWDSAIAEVMWNGEVIAAVALADVDQTAEGSARTANARTVVELYGPLSTRKENTPEFELDLADVIETLHEAEAWVRENEEDRLPVEGSEGLTPAGEALSKMSQTELKTWLQRLRGR